ncbi:hypothetical protein DPX16_17626 [Anabarilius grahami]|uniref:Uncharacterized protein n=1 Tax=Anabarilius grahami TaxID=495550 RepID=A0A3N0YI04_ANAGA|nr:hypothetical protein DPX16_17626 [Anabarilius grahami]
MVPFSTVHPVTPEAFRGNFTVSVLFRLVSTEPASGMVTEKDWHFSRKGARTRRPERESESTPINACSGSRKSSAALHRTYGFINKAQFSAGFTDRLKLKDGAVTVIMIPDMSRNSRWRVKLLQMSVLLAIGA